MKIDYSKKQAKYLFTFNYAFRCSFFKLHQMELYSGIKFSFREIAIQIVFPITQNKTQATNADVLTAGIKLSIYQIQIQVLLHL